MFFAASSDGSIHQMNLFRQRDNKSGGQITEAVGGAGVSDIIRVGDEDPQVRKKRLISVRYVTFYEYLPRYPTYISWFPVFPDHQRSNLINHYILNVYFASSGDIDRFNPRLRHPFTPAPPNHFYSQGLHHNTLGNNAQAPRSNWTYQPKSQSGKYKWC